ncbi:MAG: S9 family peptidase [Rhodohalobacter sp.]|uniref:S9 family peptidase n=1 Tax=Rhodohalobacter sp. TaxID=1974210 RepID=UPI0039763FC8
MAQLRFFLLITLLFVITGIQSIYSQAVIESWTPEAMVDQPVVGPPAISPDGSMVAYIIRETKMEGEESQFLSHIWVASADGMMNRQFTRGDQSVSNPQFSPDGEYLTFTSRRSGENQVYRMYLNGGEAEQLTHAENGVGNYSWSPDGNRIAFTMSDSKSEEEKNREKEKRDVTVVDTDFKFSRIYVQGVEADSAKAIYEGDLHTSSFDWSPDGETIVFAHQPTPKIEDRYKMDISTVPADSGSVMNIIDWEGTDSSPRFTPDGNSVAFTSHGGELEAIGLQDLYVVNLSSGEIRDLPHTYDRNASIVGFDDNSQLLIQEPRRSVSALYRVPLNGGDPTLLTEEDGIYRGFAVSNDGSHVVFNYQNSDQPAEVYTSELDQISKQKISTLHDESEFPEMGKTEVLTWTSDDGTEIEGLLTYPVGYEEGDRVPLILMVHGGPAGVYSQSWTGAGSIYAIQYFADKGYALLRPNPRGSTGYGKEFRYANFQDWGFGDYEDLMSGVDKVIEMGVADPDRLAEMGWSYGGYMTSWIVSQTDRFKAVSMGAGLSNLVSMVGTTDIPGYLLGHMGGPYWNGNMETYERHSAVYYMDNVVTPTQIIHGSNDMRVPLGQGQEFYWALQEKGVDTEMILLPRTGHGPTEPKLISEVSTRILQWFDQYIER